MACLKKILTVLIFLSALLCRAQESPVSLTTSPNTTAANEEIITVLVEIENRTSLKQEYRLKIHSDSNVRPLSNGINVALEPNEKLFVPVKAHIGKRQPAGKSEMVFTLSTGTETIAESRTVLEIPLRRSLKIKADEPQVIMERVGDTIRISVQVYNAGNETEPIEVFATFPQSFGAESTMRKKISLEPFSNTQIIFKKVVDRELLKAELFAVNIAGLDRNKEYFGNTIVMVQNALGNRRYVDPLLVNTQYRDQMNHISWRGNTPFSPYSGSQNIDLLTRFSLGDTRATVNLNGTYWNDANTDLLLQNSWLKLEHGGFSMQLGNLNSADLEISLIGRGGELTYTAGERYKKYFRIGAVEKNYNLLDTFRWNDFPRGYSVFAKSVVELDGERRFESELVTDADSFQQGYIFKNSYEFNDRKSTFYRMDLGYGLARAKTEDSPKESSLSLGLNYTKNFGKYSYSSGNYYSGGYYPGIRKGSTLLDQRLTRYFNTYSLYAAYSWNRFEPKNINPLYQYSTTSLRNKAEAGGNFNLNKNLRLNTSLQYNTDAADIYTGEYFSTQHVRFRSALAAIYLYYSTPGGKHKFDISFANGESAYVDLLPAGSIYKLQASWYFNNLMISSSYQKGNFMLYEGNINGKIVQDTEKFSTMASYHLRPHQGKLNVMTNLFATYDRYLGNSISLNLSSDYRIFRTTKLFATVNYNRFTNASYSVTPVYYQVGITQDLPGTREDGAAGKSGDIKVFAYYDHNNDGQYNPETDQPASGVKLKIRNTLFIAGADGTVRYRKVPYGQFTVKISDPDWYAADQSVMLDSRNVLVNVALQKTGVIKGKIVYQQTSKHHYEVQEQLAGLPVIFVGERGQTFTFYTDSAGNYSAFLPLGAYKIQLDSRALQKNVYVEEGFLSAVAVAAHAQTVSDLVIKVREKKVEVKKFGQD